MPRPRYHLAGSLAIGLALGGGRRLTAALLAGFLVDVDHLVDLLGRRQHRVVLPLHAWEFVPIVALLDRAAGLGGAASGAYLLHLAMDHVWNEKRSLLGYSLLYRASKRFREDELGPPDPAQRHLWRRSTLLGLARWF
jgi:hypothetical protein